VAGVVAAQVPDICHPPHVSCIAAIIGTSVYQGVPMTVFAKSSAYTHAIGIVTAALQSGSIKLQGLDNNADGPSTAGANDAAYLNSLITSIADKLTDPSERSGSGII
jgi:hypothetical protein